MVRTRSARLASLVLLTLAVCFGGAAPAAAADQSGGRYRPSQLIVFGDSNTDTGASDPDSFHNLTGGVLTGPPNVGGRFSNGEVVVEYVADRLHVPLVNFSVGGATTGRDNLVQTLIPSLTQLADTGALAQVESYRQSLRPRRADSDALYVYWAGSNDLYGVTPDQLTSRIDEALDNIETALRTLDRLGARHILVATRTPRPAFADADNVNGVVFNAALTVRLDDIDERLKADVHIFDAFVLVTDMMYFPAKYGFTQPTALCMPDPACSTNTAIAAGYVHWDSAHKTTRVHALLADRMVAQVRSQR